MVSIILRGVVTEDGQLQVKLPMDMPPGSVEVKIRQEVIEGVSLGELLKSGFVGLRADCTDIDDSVEFTKSLRHN